MACVGEKDRRKKSKEDGCKYAGRLHLELESWNVNSVLLSAHRAIGDHSQDLCG